MDYDYTSIFESKKERNSSSCHHHPARSMERLLKTESSHVGAIGPPRKLNSIICAGLLLFCVFVIVLTGEILTNKTNYHDEASKVEAEAEKILSAISTPLPEESEITNNKRLWNTKEGKTTTSSVTAFDHEDLHFEQNPSPKIKNNITDVSDSNDAQASMKTVLPSVVDESVYGKIVIFLQEGGCSETTALGVYIRKFVSLHGLDWLHGVGGFEFMSKGDVKNRRNHWKNVILHEMYAERNITSVDDQLTETEQGNLMLESIEQAMTMAKQQKKVFFFKGTNRLFKNFFF